jgi:hypothetical protein
LEGRVEGSLRRIVFRRRAGVEVGDDFFLLFVCERGITRRFSQSSDKGAVCSVRFMVGASREVKRN